jgi:argininosuccinate synthase
MRQAVQAVAYMHALVPIVLHNDLKPGNVIVVGRQSDNSLFSEKIATFEDDEGAYDQKDYLYI